MMRFFPALPAFSQQHLTCNTRSCGGTSLRAASSLSANTNNVRSTISGAVARATETSYMFRNFIFPPFDLTVSTRRAGRLLDHDSSFAETGSRQARRDLITPDAAIPKYRAMRLSETAAILRGHQHGNTRRPSVAADDVARQISAKLFSVEVQHGAQIGELPCRQQAVPPRHTGDFKAKYKPKWRFEIRINTHAG